MPQIKLNVYQCDEKGCKIIEPYKGSFLLFEEQKLCHYHFEKKVPFHEHIFTKIYNAWFTYDNSTLFIVKECQKKLCFQRQNTIIEINESENKDRFEKFIKECKKND